MKINQNIEELIDNTINSVNNVERASPKPHLLTRINARLGTAGPLSMLDKVTIFITKPWVALCGLLLILLLNVLIISSNTFSTETTSADLISEESYSVTNTALYDVENLEP